MGQVELLLAIGGDVERHDRVDRAGLAGLEQVLDLELLDLVVELELARDPRPQVHADPAPRAVGILDDERRGLMGPDDQLRRRCRLRDGVRGEPEDDRQREQGGAARSHARTYISP